MSSSASVSDSQSYLAESLDRVAESIPASLGLPRLVAIENMQALLADARGRVKDSHALQMKRLYDLTGDQMPALADPSDEMGIHVAGDTHINVTQPPAAAPVEAAKSGLSTLAKGTIIAGAIAAGVGLPLAGAGVAALLNGDETPPAAVAPVDPAPEDRDTYLPYEFSIE